MRPAARQKALRYNMFKYNYNDKYKICINLLLQNYILSCNMGLKIKEIERNLSMLKRGKVLLILIGIVVATAHSFFLFNDAMKQKQGAKLEFGYGDRFAVEAIQNRIAHILTRNTKVSR